MSLKQQSEEDPKSNSGTISDTRKPTAPSGSSAAGPVLTDMSQAEALIEQATVRASESVMILIDEWTSIRIRQNQRFHAIHARCLDIASRVRTGKLNTDQCLVELKNLFHDVVATLGQAGDEGTSDLSSWTPASWRDALSLLASSMPATATFPLPADYWKSKPEDSRTIRKKKSLNRFQRAVRSIIPGTPTLPSVEHRTLSMPDFISFHVEIPFGHLLLEEWQVFLRNRSISHHRYRDHTLEIFSELLLLLADGGTEPLTEELTEKLDAYIRLNSPRDEDHPDSAGDERRQSCTDRIASLMELNSRALTYAGTSLLPAEDFNKAVFEEEWADLEKRYESSREAWVKHTVGSQEDLKHDLILLLAQIDAVILSREAIRLFKTRVLNDYAEPLKEVAEMISATTRTLKDEQSGSVEELRKRILSQNRTLVRTLRNEKLPAILKGMESADLSKVAENFLSRVEHNLEKLPEECRIFQKDSYDSLIPDSTFIGIPLSSLVSTEALPPLVKEHTVFLEALNERLGMIKRDVGELDRAITFHLESALELLETGEAEGSGYEAASGGLSRTRHLAEKILEQEEAIATEAGTALSEMTTRFVRRVHSFTDNERVIALRAKIVQSKVKEEVGEYRETVVGTSKQILSVTLRFTEKYTAWFRERLSTFRKAAGLSGPSKEEEEDLSRWLNTVRVRINALPFPYRRLFRIEPLEDRSFFGGRFEDLEAVEEDFRSWRETSVGAMALVGEKGSGKTTILQCATKEVYQSLPVHRINLAGRSVYAEQDLLNILLETLGGAQGESFDDLEQRLANLPHPMVVLIEDIQNLFMRKVGGFSALERLLLLISTTSHSVYWVVTSTRYTWRYFEKVLTIPRFFRREIHLAGIAHEEIENIIMSRHRISGYDLRFQPPPSIEQSKKYQQMETEEEKQAYLMEDCLDRINEVASGNITLAMLCWLSACIEVKDDTVFVSFTPPDSNTLNQFPATDLFALAAVLQHETLSAAEHAEIFHQDLQESLLLIRRLVAKGLLIEQGNLFRINPLLYRSAVRTLTSKNIIH